MCVIFIYLFRYFCLIKNVKLLCISSPHRYIYPYNCHWIFHLCTKTVLSFGMQDKMFGRCKQMLSRFKKCQTKYVRRNSFN